MMHVVIRGRVQGVGFRWFAREAARALGVAGWARNRADGAVEVVADGSPAVLDAFIARLKAGPPGAAVTDIEQVAAVPEVPPANPFTILR